MRTKWKPGLYCDRCNNTGEVDCRCGGDLCVCGRQELPCPQCDGASADQYPWHEDDEDHP
jgi:hypothetical protein